GAGPGRRSACTSAPPTRSARTTRAGGLHPDRFRAAGPVAGGSRGDPRYRLCRLQRAAAGYAARPATAQSAHRLDSAKNRVLAERTASAARSQEDLSELIFQASDQTRSALQDISARTSNISAMTSRNLDAARASQIQLTQACRHMEQISGVMNGFQGSMEALEATSGEIRKILGTVQNFSAQTNMLALNAAIEAARAGEQGRG